MKHLKVAKLLLQDADGMYLLMMRSDHPEYPDDPDLPGGMVEPGESSLEGMVREVQEEAGIDIDPDAVTLAYSGTDYSPHDREYSLYICQLNERPDITISWEHSRYEWLSKDDFIAQASAAKDSYMHLAADTLRGTVRHRQADVHAILPK